MSNMLWLSFHTCSHICVSRCVRMYFINTERETFCQDINTVFTASISSLLWSSLILTRSFQPLFGSGRGRSKSRGGRLAKLPPLARNDNGSGSGEFTCCESEMTGLLMRLWGAWDRGRNPGSPWGADPSTGQRVVPLIRQWGLKNEVQAGDEEDRLGCDESKVVMRHPRV